MLRSLCATLSQADRVLLFMLDPRRDMHSRNKTAMELIAKGWSALKEVDRVIDYCELNDRRLIPLLRTAKENFELALEADNSNTHARYWLAKLHLKYHVTGKCLAVGAALLVEAANMGGPDAQYELGCCLRVVGDNTSHSIGLSQSSFSSRCLRPIVQLNCLMIVLNADEVDKITLECICLH
ncbi:hypothetical protein ACJRO7_016425 [Eucalyptus globulus]|uniref:Uncharacterized protein n=1 Tax=Eucalyptus globulus TaxID=34317 RepID=A0ABD3L703_EUCGL